MTQAWLEQKERGARPLIVFVVWLVRRGGRWLGRMLLYPICLYFVIHSDAAKDASRDYLSAVLGRRPRAREIFRHYHTFAATLLDRVFFLLGDFDRFEIDIQDNSRLLSFAAEGRGCLLIGAHIGSFEVMRAFGLLHMGLPIKVLMYQETTKRFNAVADALNLSVAESVIPLGRPDALIRAKAHIDSGGIVALLGDRVVRGDETISLPFLGRHASFPVGPMILAAALKAPVITFFGIYRGGNRYEIRLDPFIDDSRVPRADRKERVAEWLAAYAAQLEARCRDAPYNWFNFFDFWKPPS